MGKYFAEMSFEGGGHKFVEIHAANDSLAKAKVEKLAKSLHEIVRFVSLDSEAVRLPHGGWSRRMYEGSPFGNRLRWRGPGSNTED